MLLGHLHNREDWRALAAAVRRRGYCQGSIHEIENPGFIYAVSGSSFAAHRIAFESYCVFAWATNVRMNFPLLSGDFS